MDHLPVAAGELADGVVAPSRNRRTLLLGSGFASVPLTTPAVVLVLFVLAVTTGAATVTLGSQVPRYELRTSLLPFAEIMGKNAATELASHTEVQLLADVIPTALFPISADPPESPGITHTLAMIELTMWATPFSFTEMSWST